MRNLPSASSRENPSAVCVRSFVPNEKKSACRAISSARTQARGSSIIVPTRYGKVAALRLGGSDRELAQPAQLLRERDERVHDLDVRRPPGALTHGEGGAHDGAHLHLVDLRPLQAEAAAARPEHRVRLVQRLDPLPQPLVGRLLERGEELVQRRVEQPDRHRQPGHRLEDALEVALLERQQPVERRAARRLVVREDHLLDDGQALLAEEHVLGPAEPDPLGAELARLDRVRGRVRVRVHLEPPDLVRPAEDRLEIVVDPRRHELDRAEDHAAGAAVDRDHVALGDRVAADRRDSALDVDRQLGAAGDAGLAHPAGDERRVRGDAAVGGEDPLRRDQAVDVVGARLPANEDHVLARLARAPRRCPRRRPRARRRRPARRRGPWRRRRTSRPDRASGGGGGRAARGRSARSRLRGSAAPPRPSRPRP